MKAIQYARYGGPEELALVEVPDPALAADGVLIAVRAAGVAPGDCKVRQGALKAMFAVKLPKIPGRDGTGVVVAAGREANYARAGDRVAFIAQHVEQGGAAELIARRKREIAALPANLSFVEGAALAHAGVCAWISLVEKGAVAPGMKVLIHGGGGAIGSLAIQIAKHFGAHVAATTRSTNADYVAGLGADEVVAYDREDFAARLRGYDLVFDLVGGDVHRRSYRVLKKGGTLVYLIAEPIEDLSAEYGVALKRADIHDRIETLEAVLALAEKGVLRPQVGKVFPLARAADAHRLVESGAHTRGRVVLQIR
ncbi:MAG TPA: NADP-dependent oxidoreductase [Alphaproteobacteria bacterium]|jgi:NADPH:quinone reductase-like Zn-dependent oxidoreductase